MAFFSNLDDRSDITDLLLTDQRRFAPMDKFTQRLLRGPSPLTVAEREMIGAFVSGLNQCQYCHGIHKEVAKNFGVNPVVLDQAIHNLDEAELSEKMKSLLRFVRKLTLHPSMMNSDDAQLVFDAGWQERALHDAICICGLFSFYNRLLDGHGIKGNDGIYEFGAGHLSKRGYIFPWFLKYLRGFIRKKRDQFLAKNHDQ